MTMSAFSRLNPVSVAVDLVLCAGFFALIFSLVRSHVPSSNPDMVLLWSVLTSACMSVVFWLAIQMFRAVLRAQRERNQSR